MTRRAAFVVPFETQVSNAPVTSQLVSSPATAPRTVIESKWISFARQLMATTNPKEATDG